MAPLARYVKQINFLCRRGRSAAGGSALAFAAAQSCTCLMASAMAAPMSDMMESTATPSSSPMPSSE